MTSITLLGSGAAVPNKRRAPPGVLVRTGAAVLLVDPGPGALHRAAAAGAGAEEIAAVLLTHHHPDHTLDLMSLLFARRSILLKPKLKGLVLIGPAGTRDLYARMVALYGRWVEAPGEELAIVELDPRLGGRAVVLQENFVFAAIRVAAQDGRHDMTFVRPGGAAAFTAQAVPVVHADNSIGYRFQFEEGIAGLSGDSEVCDGLIAIGRNADLLILESSVPDAYRGTPGHMCPGEAGEVAARAGARRLVLYHLYPPVDARAAVRSARTSFGGPLAAARDGMVLTL